MALVSDLLDNRGYTFEAGSTITTAVVSDITNMLRIVSMGGYLAVSVDADVPTFIHKSPCNICIYPGRIAASK